jgi:hypothetical protein
VNNEFFSGIEIPNVPAKPGCSGISAFSTAPIYSFRERFSFEESSSDTWVDQSGTSGTSGIASAYGINPETGERVYDWKEWQKITEYLETNDNSEIILNEEDD